ncbi:MAG: CoA transferase, partial [Dehalococcoidia bacterium]|nr:CoA transferase [Dehalococcoidia bacterium]
GTRFPLEGVRFTDFSWYGAAPYATRLFAAYGAEIIRIESSTKLDGMRWQAPRKPGVPSSYNISGMYNNFNPGKLGITLNMAHPEARDLAVRLVSISDVVLDNFYPGAMGKWRLGYQDLVEIKPDIIVATMPVMGKTGPYAMWRGFGTSIRTMAGLDYITGNPDRPPIGTGMAALPDFSCNPYHAATAILAALHHRNVTGKGQFVEIAQFESTVCWGETSILDYTVNNRIQQADRNHLPYAAPHGVYRCLAEDWEVDYSAMPESVPQRRKKDERWCAIAVFTDDEWQAFCKAIGSPPWTADKKFATLQGRKENEEELDRLIEEWTEGRKAEEVMTLLQRAGVPAGVVQDGEDLLTRDPQLKAREFHVWRDHPEAGRIAHDGLSFALSRTPGEIGRAPLLGEHNEFVYREILGLQESEFDRLMVEKVLD